MTKQKTGVDPETEQRKKDKADYSDYVEIVCLISGNYARFVLAPRILAARRRTAGDHSASPRDYDCVCPVPDADGIPLCEGRRSACRFAGLKAPLAPVWRENQGLYDVHQTERRRITDRLRHEDPALVVAECEKMAAAIKRANALRRREFNEDFNLAATAFIA